jgi:hypothetical protein
LPKFKVPLASDDRDALLDLQDVFRRAYDQGSFGRQINYAIDPPPEVKMADDMRQWVETMLKQQKMR